MKKKSKIKLSIIGNPDPVHIGSHFFSAAKQLGLRVRLLDVRKAYHPNVWVQRIAWRLCDKIPAKISSFENKIINSVTSSEVDVLLVTGIAPVRRKALRFLKEKGITILNYLTDNPFVPNHKRRWFLDSLRYYDEIFNARESNINNLKEIGCRKVSYLPFGYNPEIHYPSDLSELTSSNIEPCDVAFVGGADRDRRSIIKPIIDAGYKVRLYGGYWSRDPLFKKFYGGNVGPQEYRCLSQKAKVSLCLVRKSNIDDNSMRTYELPAMKACVLAEDTVVHRTKFGGENGFTIFRDVGEMLSRLKVLISNSMLRKQLAAKSYKAVVKEHNTYKDRLLSMLNC